MRAFSTGPFILRCALQSFAALSETTGLLQGTPYSGVLFAVSMSEDDWFGDEDEDEIREE